MEETYLLLFHHWTHDGFYSRLKKQATRIIKVSVDDLEKKIEEATKGVNSGKETFVLQQIMKL